ncbi:hypothetical protein NUW54_g11740 [Trametes sanguinea]|uniref:Uncharacterized protein n=1 Tax=Trametes sanguinea TaxID=158606 RepID=A0ACC1NAA1_9APHY|nr:hypothetical protein NUW54_g11740 [Trametes sanguinea]
MSYSYLAWPPLAPRIAFAIADNERKSAAFFEQFYLPPLPDADIAAVVPEDMVYPPPAYRFEPPTDHQIERTIRSLPPDKAPGPDGIINRVYKAAAPALVPHLGPLFRATFSLNHYPNQWKVFKTVVLRKPGKPDYCLPKAHRPIALMNCLSKILSACVAEELSFQAERLHMLPSTQFGATRTLHQRQPPPPNIKSAFPSVTPAIVAHDMRMCGVPCEVTDWFLNKSNQQRTVLCFDNYISEEHTM